MNCPSCLKGHLKYIYSAFDPLEGLYVSGFYCPHCHEHMELKPPPIILCVICGNSNTVFIPGAAYDYQCLTCGAVFDLDPFTQEDDEGEPDNDSAITEKRP